MSPGLPCDMPCDGCADGKSPGCMLACGGLIAALPTIDPGKDHAILAERILFADGAVPAGNQPEPDTPPPKIFLA